MVAKHTAHHDIWEYRALRPHLLTKGETFPEGGYDGVPDKKVKNRPHVASWPNVPALQTPSAKGEAGGIERFVTARLSKMKLRAAIMKLVVTGDLPFRIVELNAGVIPSRWTVARNTVVLADLALEAAIAELASTTCAVPYSTDMWTGPNGKAYMVLTGHFMSEQWELRQVILAFVEMPDGHGGKDIATAVEKVVEQWKLQTRCLGLTTDNASANVVALRHLSEEGDFSGCMSHIVNLAVQSGLGVESMQGPLKKVLDIASWVGMSPKRGAAFIALQVQNGPLPNGPHKLVQDSPVRWGSTHEMVLRFLLLRPFIDMHFAREQGSTYPTVSMVLPYFNGLIDSLEKKLHTGTHELVRPLMAAALQHLKKYEFAVGEEYRIATFLDPSMKAEYFRMTNWELQHPGIVACEGGRLKPRRSADTVVSLVRCRVEEYQARAARDAPTPPPAPPAAVVTPFEDDDDEFVFSRAQLRSGEQAPPELALEGEGLDKGDNEEVVAVAGGGGVE
ncbi:unnamed protein product [Closterium sp. Naga37s-1]|nr:unnamed protein product [Closterium sp. Naga37s-1]